MSAKHWRPRYLTALVIALFSSGVWASTAGIAPITRAARNCLPFPQTDTPICDPFLTYWTTHGGLSQLGLPLTMEFAELSSENGRSYTTQYFERAVLEYHPENNPPNAVLLRPLGVRELGGRHPEGQRPNPVNTQLFPQTHHTLGGRFRTYWVQHGGPALQGYPLTEEFTERRTDGKDYTVQYFERSLFEYHPENQPPYEVLLAPLGQTAYHQNYLAARGCPPTCEGDAETGAFFPPPIPSARFRCDLRANPPGTTIHTGNTLGKNILTVRTPGFTDGEGLRISLINPAGARITTEQPEPPPFAALGGPSVRGGGAEVTLLPQISWLPGAWSLALEGATSRHRAVVRFCIYDRTTTRVWPLVRPGDSGAQVAILQYLLRARGYAIAASGGFDDVTYQAVRRFQTTRRLPVTGQVGPLTWEALVVPTHLSDQGDAVRAVQIGLAQRILVRTMAGQPITRSEFATIPFTYDRGANFNKPLEQLLMTGRFDQQTAALVQQVQIAGLLPTIGVPATGVVGLDTWYELVRVSVLNCFVSTC